MLTEDVWSTLFTLVPLVVKKETIELCDISFTGLTGTISKPPSREDIVTGCTLKYRQIQRSHQKHSPPVLVHVLFGADGGFGLNC